MRQPTSASAACLALALAACAPEGASASLDAGPLATLPKGDDAGPLPAHPTARENAGKADGFDPRDDYPEAYGFTAPPAAPSAVPTESAPITELLIGWGAGGWENEQFFAEIIRAAATEVDVTVVVPDQRTANDLDYDFSRFGVDMSRVGFVLFQLDSIWMRDYGPLSARSATGATTVVDPRYYWGRWMDDYFPTAYAPGLGAAVARPPIEMEGGNFLADGAGRCVATEDHVPRNAIFGYSAQDIRDLFAAYYGCAETTLVPTMVGEGTGHVDMHVHVVGPGQVIVGEYPSTEDPVNAQRLDETARRLEAAGFGVRRVPMPWNDGRSVFRSYTNALAVNDKVLVPVYSGDRRFEAEALATFQAAYPGRTIVPIASEGIIQWAGAVHCVTMTY